MYSLIKKILFIFPPETAHHLTMSLLILFTKIPFGEKILRNVFSVKNKDLQRNLFGLTFKNPIGLAAGFDKDAKYADVLDCLGFGFIEIGTVTPLPQPGNEQPRLFRLPKDKALINRMGFNNEGAIAAAQRLKKRKSKIIIGGNIGKNKNTVNENATADYEKCFLALFDVVDYFVVNVSSPNTPGLRSLQEKEPLQKLLSHLQEINKQQQRPKPILLKIAPDLTDDQLDDIIEIVNNNQMAGIIATNTTISRNNLQTPLAEIQQMGSGGLSGKPLQQRATEIIKYIRSHATQQIPIIAVGGIFTAADAKEKLDAGASLLQIYTGLIYEGPAVVKNICKNL